MECMERRTLARSAGSMTQGRVLTNLDKEWGIAEEKPLIASLFHISGLSVTVYLQLF